jgi:cyclophilin family peptidyl-prolyl cis-trans isomerase
MPTSRRWRKNQNKAGPRRGKRSKPNRSGRSRKISVAVGIVAVAAVLVSAFYVMSSGLFSGSNTPDWSLYNGTKVRLMVSGGNITGNITLQLRTDKPITTTNFLNLTSLGLYNNTIFHRVIAGFMIQGGGIANVTIPDIPDEIGNYNRNFNTTIAMANTGAVNSANSQFFINVADNNNLNNEFDKSYTVFGRVIDGMDVVMKISQVATTNEKPNQDITLIRAEVLP